MTILGQLLPDLHPHLEGWKTVLREGLEGVLARLDGIRDAIIEQENSSELHLQKELTCTVDTSGVVVFDGPTKVPPGWHWEVKYITGSTNNAAGVTAVIRLKGSRQVVAIIPIATNVFGEFLGSVLVDFILQSGTELTCTGGGGPGAQLSMTLWGTQVRTQDTEEGT